MGIISAENPFGVLFRHFVMILFTESLEPFWCIEKIPKTFSMKNGKNNALTFPSCFFNIGNCSKIKRPPLSDIKRKWKTLYSHRWVNESWWWVRFLKVEKNIV